MRKYKKRPKRRNPDRRMAAAVRLRAEGMSLRQIAKELACSHDTVWRDLARWDAAHAIANVSDFPVRNIAPGVTNLTDESDSPTNIVELRRKA